METNWKIHSIEKNFREITLITHLTQVTLQITNSFSLCFSLSFNVLHSWQHLPKSLSPTPSLPQLYPQYSPHRLFFFFLPFSSHFSLYSPPSLQITLCPCQCKLSNLNWDPLNFPTLIITPICPTVAYIGTEAAEFSLRWKEGRRLNKLKLLQNY